MPSLKCHGELVSEEVKIINSPHLLKAARICFPPCWSIVNLFPSSVSDFSSHGYEVIGSVARPSSVEVPNVN